MKCTFEIRLNAVTLLRVKDVETSGVPAAFLPTMLMAHVDCLTDAWAPLRTMSMQALSLIEEVTVHPFGGIDYRCRGQKTPQKSPLQCIGIGGLDFYFTPVNAVALLRVKDVEAPMPFGPSLEIGPDLHSIPPRLSPLERQVVCFVVESRGKFARFNVTTRRSLEDARYEVPREIFELADSVWCQTTVEWIKFRGPDAPLPETYFRYLGDKANLQLEDLPWATRVYTKRGIDSWWTAIEDKDTGFFCGTKGPSL